MSKHLKETEIVFSLLKVGLTPIHPYNSIMFVIFTEGNSKDELKDLVMITCILKIFKRLFKSSIHKMRKARSTFDPRK